MKTETTVQLDVWQTLAVLTLSQPPRRRTPDDRQG